MGARVYIPALGRFLQVDPVEGGTSNNYVYVTDPVNGFDLTGTIGFKKWFVDRGRNVRTVYRAEERGRQQLYNWEGKHPRLTQALAVLATSRGGGKMGPKGNFEKISKKQMTRMQKRGEIDAHAVKSKLGGPKIDIWKDKATGRLYTMPKDGKGPPQPLEY